MSGRPNDRDAPRVAAAQGDDAASRAALAVMIALALLTLARLGAGVRSDTWAWGFAPHTFLPRASGLALALLPLALLVPPLARLVLRPMESLGRAAGTPARAALLGALLAAIPVALWPDHLWFIGDFFVRQGATENAWLGEGSMFQAMPLDALLHNVLPAALAHGSPERANLVLRVVGIAEAALFGAAAGWSAFELGLRGALLVAGVSALACGGCLVVFTGLGKAAGLMCAVSLVVITLAARVMREGRGLVALGLAISAALFSHRAAILLLPAWAMACFAWRAEGGWRGPRGRDEALAGVLLPLLLLAFLTPRLVWLIARLDLPGHAGLAAGSPGSWLAATFDPVRLADAGNVFFALAPVAAVALLAAPFLAKGPRERHAGGPLALMTLAAAAMFLLVRPSQGSFRDWDVFAFAGVIVSLAAVRALGPALDRAPSWRWLAPALAAAAIVPTFQWLWLAHDADRGAVRVRRFVEAPPLRPEIIRAHTWNYLATFYNMNARWVESSTAAAQAARLAPSPRYVLEWAVSSVRAQNDEGALRAFRLLTERSPRDPLGWVGLLSVSRRLGVREDAERARAVLRDHPIGEAGDARVRAFLGDIPELVPAPPDSAR